MMNTDKKITASLFVLVLALFVVGTASICAATTYPAPELQSPQNGAVVTISPITFSWGSVPEAVYYILVNTSATGGDSAIFSIHEPSFITATSWTWSEEDLNDVVYNNKRDTFYWKVTALCGTYLTYSPDSSIWSFNVLKWPAAWIDQNYWNGITETDDPALWESMASGPLGGWQSPDRGHWSSNDIAVTTLHSVPLIWSDYSDDSQQTPVAFADLYRVQLSTSSTFDSPFVNTTTENISYTTPELSPGAYYWRVRSETNDGLVTEWNSPRKFVIASGPTVTMGVSVSISPTSQSGANGATLTYTVTVNNTGNASDSYSLTVTDDAGWSPSVSPTSILNISSGSGLIGASTLSVTIPSGAVEGTIDSITVTAISQTDSTVENSATCTATATAGGGATDGGTTGGGTSPLVYVGAVVGIVAVLGAVLVVIKLKPF